MIFHPKSSIMNITINLLKREKSYNQTLKSVIKVYNNYHKIIYKPKSVFPL